MGTPFPLRGIDQIYGTPFDSNFAQLTIPEVDRLVPMIATEMDHEVRVGYAQQAATAIWEAVHTVPLWQRPALMGVRDTIANFGSLGVAQVPYDWTMVGFVDPPA